MRLKLLCASFLLTIASTVLMAETWGCEQFRDMLVGPPYYVDQGETDLPFSIKVAGFAIKIASDDS